MSREPDLLRRIADARAQMLMRGYDPLHIDIGRVTVRELVPWLAHQDGWASEILGLPYTVRDDMEGFAIWPASP